MRRDDQPIRPPRDLTRPRSQPGQGWVCGFAELGQSCRSGPTCDGRCGRNVPTDGAETIDHGARDVDLDAGPSAELPPCIPRRSLAFRRRALRLNLAILTAGFLMLCMALPSREKIFVPGELSFKHAQILDNTLQSQRCGLCHPSSHSSDSSVSGDTVAGGLLSSARRLIENDGRQDQLCMQCHQGHLPSAGNRDPHDLSPAEWQKLRASENETPWQLVSTRRSATDLPASSADSSEPSSQGNQRLSKTSCAMCHNEHHGRGFDIKLISDSRCQACHQRQFESFASGHPELKNFPVDRPRGLAFSHGQHAQDHFPKKNREFDCKACHLSTLPTGSSDLVTRSLSFEHACASCHDQPIRAATIEGWATIQLPSIEASDATSSEAELVDWPVAARYGYDGVVSPVMRALLMADKSAMESLQKLPASGKIVDISSISANRARVAKTLAAATRRLLQETAQDGQAAWIARLQKVTREHLGRELNDREQALIGSMTAGLPPDVFRHADSEWWGHRKALASLETAKARLATAPRSQQITSNPPADDDLLLGSSDLNGNASQPNNDLLGNEDLLVEPNKTSQADELLGSKDSDTKQPAIKLVKGATHLVAGGWYVDQTTLSIRYMPTGHADATLAAWSLWWSIVESHRPVLPATEAERIAQRLNLAASTNPVELNQNVVDSIPGKCSECHQLKLAAAKFASVAAPFRVSDSFEVPERDRRVREFTKFQHTAHLTLPALADCRYCHQEKNSQPIVSQKFVAHQPSMSEFAEMKVSQCAACHRPGGASDRCVQCHNYHVSVPKP